ncbi:MAG: hypothetical protein ACLRMZ_08255 [Blautia marasmi]
MVLSGYAEFEYAKTALSLGASAYLLKPLSNKDLKEELDKLLMQVEVDTRIRRDITSRKNWRRRILRTRWKRKSMPSSTSRQGKLQQQTNIPHSIKRFLPTPENASSWGSSALKKKAVRIISAKGTPN